MDLFDLVAKITLDTKDYEKSIKSAEDGAKNVEKSMLELQGSYNVAQASVKELSGALREHIKENGNATSTAQELGYMLAEEQQKADDAQKAMKELAGSEKKVGDEASGTTSKVSTFADKLKTGLANAAKLSAVAIGAATSGVIALAGAMFKGAVQTAEYGDQVDKMSQKLGLSTDAYQKWDYVLSQSGADINSMQTGLKTLTNKLDEAKNGSAGAQEMFAKLGLSMEDLGNMSREEVFEAAIKGFQGMADSTERAALANDLFGRSGQELAPLFNTSIEQTEELMKAAEDLGFVMSEDAVKASADYKDSLDTLQRTFGGMKNQLLGEFLPSMSKVMDGLAQLFGGDAGTGLATVKEGISDLVQHLSDQLPEFLDLGTEMVLTLGEAIVENLPTLIDAGTKGLLAIVDGIVDHLPQILTAAFKIIQSLAGGLIKAIPQLVAAIPKLISALVQGFLALGKEFLDVGAKLVEGIKQGISNAWGGLINKATSLGKNLLGKVKGLFGIHSPSTVFAGIGENMAAGLGIGWEREFKKVEEDITDGLDFTGSARSPQIDALDGLRQSLMIGYTEAQNGVRTQLEGLKIYLDTGLLVGGIAPTMNNTLGRTYVQNVRGAMA